MRTERPLWQPFTTTTGIIAVRTPAGVVPYVALIHREHVVEHQRQHQLRLGEPVFLIEEVERARLLAEMEAEARGDNS